MFTDQRQYLRYLQITSDLICFALLYLLILPAVIAVYGDHCPLFVRSGNPLNDTCIYKSPLYLLGSLAAILISTLVSGAMAVLSKNFSKRPWTILCSSLALCLVTWALLWLLFDTLPLPRDNVLAIALIAVLILFLFLTANRIDALLLMQKSQTHHFLIKHVVLAGTGQKSIDLARYILAHPETGLRVAGFLTIGTRTAPEYPVPGLRVLGSIPEIPTVVQHHVVDLILAAEPACLDRQMDMLFRTCATMGIGLGCTEAVPSMTERVYPGTGELNGVPFHLYNFVSLNPLSAYLKRIFDFTCSAVLIFLCLPFWVVVPLMIKSSSKGPVFFRQERIGKAGRKFILYKFRSMHENAEELQDELMHLNEMDGPAFKIKNDPRQTPTGKVLRAYSLDELPQLFNVFVGDISLVGPRPAKANEVRQYRPAERRRLSVIQGITCIWQVSGRNEIKFDEWMKLDLMYIDNWSSAKDFKILFKTIPAVLMKRGAY